MQEQIEIPDEIQEEIWRPNPGPQEFALRLRGFREILYGGARGGGKTEWGIERVGPSQTMNRHPRYRGLVIRLNAVDLTYWVDRATQRWEPFGVRRKGDPPIFIFPTGGIVRTGHLQDEKAYSKYLSHEYHKLLIEELTTIPTLDRYLNLISCVRSKIPDIVPEILATTNPGGDGHQWVKNRFVVRGPWGTPFRLLDAKGNETSMYGIYIPARVTDTPQIAEGDPLYIEYLASLPEKRRRAWLDGDWDAYEGQMFPEFSRDRHVIAPMQPPSWWKKYRSIDWGFSPDPWTCGWYAVDELGHEIKYREAHGWEMTPEEVALKILELSRDDGGNFGMTVADPSMWTHRDESVSTAEKMERAGLPLEKGNNERIQGWMRIHEYLRNNPVTGIPWLRICANCIKSIEALPLLVHDQKKVEDAAAHSMDHWPDHDRYHLMRRPARGHEPGPVESWKTKAGFERLAAKIGR